MSDNEILEQLNKIIFGLKCINLKIIEKRNPVLLEIILRRTAFLSSTATLKERIFCIKNNIINRPVCPVCKIGFLIFNRKTNSYSAGCCHSCTCQSNEFKTKMLTKYGVESPNAANSVKKLKTNTLLAKYGVDNPSKIPEVQQKKQATSFKKHGVQHWTNTEQAKITYLEKTGYSNPSKNPEIKNKKSESCRKNIGYDNPSKSEFIKKKKINTCIKNYGVKFGFMINRHIVYNSVSNLSKRIYKILDFANILYKKEYRLYVKNTYRSYDIAFPEKMLLLELNGDYWHANPKKFKANDIINLPHIGKVLASSIWVRDAEKKNIAEDNGYTIVYLWESDMKKMSDNEILAWIMDKLNISPENS